MLRISKDCMHKLMASFIASNPIASCVAGHQYPKLLISQRAATSKISVRKPVQRFATSQLSNATEVRRSANYQPTLWNDEYLQSLTNEYTGDACRKRAEELKEKGRAMINNADNPLEQLELIDTLQKLGLAYHFEDEIKRVTQTVYSNNDDSWKKGNLYAISLEFRLLRQHGYDISQDVFNDFKDKMGDFKPCLCQDIKAMLSFYEASYYGLEGEAVMEEAWQFTTKHLKNLEKDVDHNLAEQVKHAFDLPLHWRPPRFETEWFIDFYDRKEDKNQLLLELAKLDFNIVQEVYQEDLKDLSRWWENTGLGAKLGFVRDRLVTSFLWGVGIAFEPQYSYCRKMITKAIILITVFDDIYDVYGSLPELELFTGAIQSWDTKAMEKLPNYMKLAFLAHHNYVNEMGYDILKEQDVDVMSPLRKAWARTFKAYMVEAKWFHTQFTPPLEEYLNNGLISITGPVIALIAYLSTTNPLIQKELDFLESKPEIIHLSALIFRLQDDLGTSSDEIKRGDVAKAIQCYMNDTGASEEAAREYIKDLTRQLWKKLNVYKTTANNPLCQTITEIICNITRTSQAVYLNGDGFGVEEVTEDLISSLCFNPIFV